MSVEQHEDKSYTPGEIACKALMPMHEKMLIEYGEPTRNSSIQELLNYCGAAIGFGLPLSPALAKYISARLIKIGEGADANEAFGISYKKGQKNIRWIELRDFEIAYFINEMNVSMVKRYEVAGKKFNVSPETAKRAWIRNKLSIRIRRELRQIVAEKLQNRS